ncbi:hypothetical protein [Paractinoplanes toevensis]|uniref:hypothetical protein n=1 Tax=Paractinoplanes toevensis TaxID=571911 RepID=UPI001BB2F2E0|nr:hypothetical protein [Actinoplanes toevensis]
MRLVVPKGLAKIAAPELTLSLDMDLASQGDKKIHLTGSQKITPHVAFASFRRRKWEPLHGRHNSPPRSRLRHSWCAGGVLAGLAG